MRSRRLEGVDWDGVLAALVSELGRRPELAGTAIELGWQRCTALIDRNRFEAAREALEDVTARLPSGHPRRGWVATSQAQLEFAEEHWLASRAALDLAERELAEGRVGSPAAFREWLDALQAEYWIQIGMPELALEPLARMWAKAEGAKDVFRQWKAFDVHLQYLLVANDYAGLEALEQKVEDLGWLGSWSEVDRERARMRFALGLVEQGVASPADNAEARERLVDVLAEGLLPRPEQSWALVALGLAALDAEDLELAADAAAELRALLAERRTLDLTRPENTVAPRLIALEGLVALARHARGEADAAQLAAHLSAAQEAWQSLRSGWAEVPTRDGGIGYLFLSQRQILVEALIGLLRAVHGEDEGALAALQWLVEAQSESTLARRLDAPRADFQAARTRLLDARTGVVAWIPLRGRSYALAADGARARIFELPRVDELEARARDVSGALQRAVSGDDGDAWSALETGLAAAREAFLPDELSGWIEPLEALYLVGLDDAGFVPFEMLPARDGLTQGAERALCRMPSLPVELVLAERAQVAPPAEPRALVLFADRPDPERARARGVVDLVEPPGAIDGLVEALQCEGSQRLQGETATWDGLERGLAAPCQLLHVVAHGVQRAHERPPGILLAHAARGVEVFAEDLEALRAPPIVLLSVCGAARSRLRRGDAGRSDLGAALLVAGASTVASSFSDLDLGPTLRVGTQVHEALAEGATLADALRDTRRALCDDGERGSRDWLAAHALQVGGAGLTARLRAPGTAPERGRVRTALVVLALGAGLALVLYARRRTAPARAP